MKKNIITIFEYGEKIIGPDEDVDLSKKEISALIKLNRKIKEAQKTGGDVMSCEYYSSDRCKIKTNSYVGILSVGKKTIQILPKMARTSLTGEEYNRQAIKNLLYMLAYTKKLQIKETDLSALKNAGDNFFEVLIFLFAKNLLNLIQNDTSKEYVDREDNLPYIKGKLQFSNHLKQNLIARNRFYLQYDEFCEDNLLNQIFKYTTHLLLRTSNSFNNIKMLQELKFLFSDITHNRIVIDDFKKVNLTRLNKAYEPVLNLCKIFIGMSSLELSVDRIHTFSFVFDMNMLFEEFIGQFIKRSFYNDYGRITLQRPTKHLVENKCVNNHPEGKVFLMRPDIQLGNSGDRPEIIIDTKYKLLKAEERKEGVSQGDLYQMNAYSKKYECPRIILLYPRLETQGDKNIRFEIDASTNVYVRTVDLCRDLKVEREGLKNELSNILSFGNI